MARITITNCLKNPKIKNKFELVLLASLRAKSLSVGEESKAENSKEENSSIVALREIEQNIIDIDELKKNFLSKNNHKKFSFRKKTQKIDFNSISEKQAKEAFYISEVDI